jgi:hypothetical protein
VRAVHFSPLSTDADAWTVYPALVAAAVDLLVAGFDPEKDAVNHVAHAVVRRVGFGLAHDVGVFSLLHSLCDLATAFPRLLCTSSLVFQFGAVLLHEQSATREQTLVLRILQLLLDACVPHADTHGVYLEALLVPLVSVQATHTQDATALLQRVLETASTTTFQSVASNEPSLGVGAAHAASYLALVKSPGACERWLESLFQDKNPEIQDSSSTLLMQLGACLIDRRGRVRTLALEALARQLQLRRLHKNADWTPSHVKLLVSTLVVVTSYRPANASASDALWLSQSFHVLATLAATKTETMTIILRLIKRMATSNPQLRPQALTLLLLVWKQDTRVYPQLEAMLHQTKEDGDENDEAQLVRMATILALCDKDPETGVEWIVEIQSFLEADCVSMVAMAVRAVALLCIADCLDYGTTVKMFIAKVKKKKISCSDDPRFQQELCQLYAIGGPGGFVEASPKYGARVISDLWEYAEAQDASVRVEALAALNGYSLEALGLRLSPQQGGDNDEDEDDEDILTEQDVEDNVDRVWAWLQIEKDNRVRVQLEHLVEKILDAESHTLAPGGARRTGIGVASAAAFASTEQRISAAATKELKKLLPTREESLVGEQENWCAHLLAYEPANVVDSGAAAKRKDKRLRLVMGHVDDMQAIMDRCLKASSSSTDAQGVSSPLLFLQLLQSVNAWNSFARKFFGRLDELALLRTPMDAPVGHTEGVLTSLLIEHTTRLTKDESSIPHSQRWLVLGALAHQACFSASSELLQEAITKIRSLLRTRLLQSMEELRVFKDATHAVDVQHLLLGLLLAYPTESDSQLEAAVTRVLPVVYAKNNEGSELMRAAAVLFVSHASALFHHDESRAAQRQRLKPGIECAATSLLGNLCGEVAAADIAAKLLTDASPDIHHITKLVKKSSSTFDSTVVAWASAMGVARLVHRLASVHRLQWLDNLRLVLEAVWTNDSTLVGAVALGPVLLESVRHNRVAVAAVQEFTSTLQRRMDEASADVGVVGALVLPYVLLRVGTYVHVDRPRSDIEAFLTSLESGATSAFASFFCVAAGNLLYGTTGVRLCGTTTTPEREIAVDDMAAIERLSIILRSKLKPQPALSRSADCTLAGISDRADAFVVVQKNKTFDVQITTLPPTSLVFKMLSFLRLGNGEDDGETSRKVVQSALRCVAYASRSFPLPLDLSTLATRATSRHALADDVLATCLDLAASHASGITLLLTNLLAPERLVNYSPRVVDACVDAVATARGRLTPPQLTTLVSRVFDALVDWSRRDGTCSIVSAAFSKWIVLVGSLLETAVAEEAQADDATVSPLVSTLVLKDFMPRLPFTPDHSSGKSLLGQFARDILSTYKDRISTVTEALLRASSLGIDDGWTWWRSGLLLSHLLRLGSISSSAVVFRWLLQLDLSCVDDKTSALDAFTADVVESICVSTGNKAPIQVNEPWLLELLDGVAQLKEDKNEGAARNRRVLFAAAQSVLSWTQLRGHEAFLLRDALIARETIAASLPVLVARALVLHHRGSSSEAAVSLVQRLWTIETLGEDAVGRARDTVVKELYVMASEAPRPQLLTKDMEMALAAQLSIL